MGILNQILAGCAFSVVCVGIGLIQAWPSYTLVLFQSENTTLSRPMTVTEISLFGSLASFGGFLTTPLSGYLVDKIGRKYLTICVAVIQVLAWILRLIFTNIIMILFSCLLNGIAGCGILVIVVFIGEISQESIRGTLASIPVATSALGIMISFWIGGTLNYYTINYICLSISVLGILMISFLRESPTYLMTKGLEEEAIKSIAFYRNTNIDSEEVSKVVDTIKRALNPILGETPVLISETAKLAPAPTTRRKLSIWQFIKQSRSSRRALGISFILTVLSIFQGMNVVQVYAVSFFKDAVPNISSTMCTVLMSTVNLIGSFVCGLLTDIAGRKTLMMYASISAGLCCILLGLQLQLFWGPNWLTVVLVYLYSVSYVFGAGTIPFVLLSELFLPEIKGFASMLIMETVWLSTFIGLFVFNPLVTLIGLPRVFYIFATICFSTTIFTFFMLPETKGLSVDAIQLLFTSKKANTRKNINIS